MINHTRAKLKCAQRNIRSTTTFLFSSANLQVSHCQPKAYQLKTELSIKASREKEKTFDVQEQRKG